MRSPLFVLFVFFPEVFLHSRVTEACPVTTDLIVPVIVKTTTIYLASLGVPLGYELFHAGAIFFL